MHHTPYYAQNMYLMCRNIQKLLWKIRNIEKPLALVVL